MSIKLMTAAWELEDLTSGQKLVMLALCDNGNDDGVCWPSIETVAKKCGMGIRTVHRHIADLSSMGMLKVMPRPGKTDVFQVTIPGFEVRQIGIPTPANLAKTPANLAKPYKENHQEPSAPVGVRKMDLAFLKTKGIETPESIDWLRARKSRGAPALTETSWAMLERQAKTAGMPVELAVKVCAEHGWQTFKADYDMRGSSAAVASAGLQLIGGV